MPLAETWVDIARSWALKADEALNSGEPLILETKLEKVCFRQYAEREYAYWKRQVDGC